MILYDVCQYYKSMMNSYRPLRSLHKSEKPYIIRKTLVSVLKLNMLIYSATGYPSA